MIDISKIIKYWQCGAEEDWEVAEQLIEGDKHRHGLFFAHLALEKVLKAHVCHHTQNLAPRIHNLVRLSELTKLNLEEKYIDILAEMNEFNLEGRYPSAIVEPPTPSEAKQYFQQAKEVYQWLKSRL